MRARAAALQERATWERGETSTRADAWSMRARTSIVVDAIDRAWRYASETRDEEDVCARRSRRVRAVTCATVGGMMVIGALARGGGRDGTARSTGVARLGASNGEAWIDDLIASKRLDLDELDCGPWADKTSFKDPNSVGGLGKKWVDEFAQDTTPGSYDKFFDGHRKYPLADANMQSKSRQSEQADGRVYGRHGNAKSTLGTLRSSETPEIRESPFSSAENIATSTSAPRNDDAMDSYVGDLLKNVGDRTIEENGKTYVDAPDLGGTSRQAKSGDGLNIADLFVSAGNAKEFASGKGEHESKSKSSSKPSSHSKLKHSGDEEEEEDKKSSTGMLQKFFSKKEKPTLKKHEDTKSNKKTTKKDTFESMTFNELSFAKKPLSLKDRLDEHELRMSGRLSKYPGSSYPSNKYPSNKYPSNKYPSNKYPSNKYPSNKYPSNKYPSNRRKDQDENDENDEEVFYKASDLLDLGEYDQATIDDFRYGRGLVPRDGGSKSTGITVSTDVDVANYPSGGSSYPGGRTSYPTAKTGKHIGGGDDALDLDEFMSSLKVDSAGAHKHVESRKRLQKEKVDASTSKLSTSDWSGDEDSTEPSVKKSSFASKTKASKPKQAKALSTSDWSEEVEDTPRSSTKSKVSPSSKDASMDWDDESEESEGDNSGRKIGKMSKADAAKYLSKVKGHNTKTHAKLRNTIPKLGAMELDDLYDEGPQFDQTEEDGHNMRHRTIAKVVEAAAAEGSPIEASLGRKQSTTIEPASHDEIMKGGAWRKVVFGGRNGQTYRKVRTQIFDAHPGNPIV